MTVLYGVRPTKLGERRQPVATVKLPRLRTPELVMQVSNISLLRRSFSARHKSNAMMWKAVPLEARGEPMM
jgi:hypothetical protein